MKIIEDLTNKYSELFSEEQRKNLTDVQKLDVIENKYGWYSLPHELRTILERHDIYNIADGIGVDFSTFLDEDKYSLLNTIYIKPFYFLYQDQKIGGTNDIPYLNLSSLLNIEKYKDYANKVVKDGVLVDEFVEQFLNSKEIEYNKEDYDIFILTINNKEYRFIFENWFEFTFESLTIDNDFGVIDMEFKSLADLLRKLEGIVMIIK